MQFRITSDWLDRFGETSYDHQSYFAGPVGGRAKALYYQRPRLGTLAVAPMILSEAFLPSARRLFWQKQRFPIADAHYAMGFALLAEATGETRHLDRAVHFLDVLEQTRCPATAHHGWGYPFDWVTRNGVMRARYAADHHHTLRLRGFRSVHRLDGDERWRTVMESIAEHALPRHSRPRALGATSATAGYNPHD